MALKALFYPDVPFETLYIPFIYKEIYFDNIYVDIFNEGKDMVVMDVGANIGVVTQYMRERCKKVYSIEPSPEHFEALKKNKEFNNWDNVEVFNLAFADKDGEATLTQNERNRTMNSIVIGETVEPGRMKLDTRVKDLTGTISAQGYDNKTTVKTQSIATFLKENNIEKVDFMKFDVEGAEDMILRSDAFLEVFKKIRAIEVEFHYPTWPNLVDYLVNLGYKPRRYDCGAIVILFTRND